MQHYLTAPPSAAPGLDLFAAAWLERWLAHGGTMIVNPDGTGQSGLPADDPNAKEPPDGLSDSSREYHRTFSDGIYIGRTRELLDLLELVPGGREAVKAHVRAYPSFAYAGGVVGVM